MSRSFTNPLCCLFLVLSLASLDATAEIRQLPEMDRLLSLSDVIVQCELIKVERIDDRTVEVVNDRANPAQSRTLPVRAYHAEALVYDVVKGSPQLPFHFDILVPTDREDGWLRPSKPYGLFFLERSVNGELTTFPEMPSFVSMPRGFTAVGKTPMDRLVSTFQQLLTLPGDRNANGSALEYLMFSQGKESNAVLRAALDTVRNFELQSDIANALLFQGDAFALKFVKQVFLSEPRLSLNGLQLLAMGNNLGRIRDPIAIRDLTDLLSAPASPVRSGAARALGQTASPQAVQPLAKALDDPDAEVRYWGVVGLAEITGQGEWRPTDSAFKSDEHKYIEHWRTWLSPAGAKQR